MNNNSNKTTKIHRNGWIERKSGTKNEAEVGNRREKYFLKILVASYIEESFALMLFSSLSLFLPLSPKASGSCVSFCWWLLYAISIKTNNPTYNTWKIAANILDVSYFIHSFILIPFSLHFSITQFSIFTSLTYMWQCVLRMCYRVHEFVLFLFSSFFPFLQMLHNIIFFAFFSFLSHSFPFFLFLLFLPQLRYEQRKKRLLCVRTSHVILKIKYIRYNLFLLSSLEMFYCCLFFNVLFLFTRFWLLGTLPFCRHRK